MRKSVINFLLALMLIWVGACSDDSPVEPENPSIWIREAQISGVGTDRVGPVEITDGFGYCYIEGDSIPAMVYDARYWEVYDLTVFHTVAPTRSELHVLYLYSAADTLRTIWHESYTNPLESEQASGSVVYDERGILSTPQLWCLEDVPADDQLVTGLTIAGPQLNWSSGVGSIEIENQEYELYPFQLVDCIDCGETPDDGWYELHTVFRGPRGEMEFGILYLFADRPGLVKLYYRIQLCDLRLGDSSFYYAEWTLEPDAGKVGLPAACSKVGR